MKKDLKLKKKKTATNVTISSYNLILQTRA